MAESESLLERLRRHKGAGEHLGVLKAAREILNEPSVYTDQALLEVARAGATAAMELRELNGAGLCVEFERMVAEKMDDPELVAMAAFRQATVKMEVGDSAEALGHFQTFIEVDGSGRPGLDRFRGMAHFNLGTVLMWRKDYVEAGNAFRQAREAFLEQGNTEWVIRSILQVAWSEVTAGRPEPAGAYLDQAQELLAEFEDADLRTTALCHRAYYHYTVGELDLALNLCNEVLAVGRQHTTPHQMGEAAWIAGECRFAQGHLPQALDLAKQALEIALSESWSSGMSRAGNLRTRILRAMDQTA
ncbi:MAG TPA: tetratricopeptide repeat protein [Symbiobacteriaceae bacterium]|nr:tetratricopeptide repeat protein [Symbiobacteriaceae bacterium]